MSGTLLEHVFFVWCPRLDATNGMKKISNKFHQGVLTIISFLVIFAERVLKLENIAQLFQVLIHAHSCHCCNK